MGVTNPEGVKKYFVAAFPRFDELNERKQNILLTNEHLFNFLALVVKQIWRCYDLSEFLVTKSNVLVSLSILQREKNTHFLILRKFLLNQMKISLKVMTLLGCTSMIKVNYEP